MRAILAPLKAAQAAEIARDWVAGFAAGHREFRGAHLMGGVTSLARDAEMPPESDLDLSVLVAVAPQPGQEVVEELHRGVVIEAGLRSVEEYRSAEAVLGNPEIACHLVVDSLLADPGCILAAVQPVVAQDYSRKEWLIARCEAEKRRVELYLDAAARVASPSEFATCLLLGVQNLTALLAVALLEPPTHRKCLINFGAQLRGLGRSDLAEESLIVVGVAHITRAGADGYLERLGDAFDRAVEVRRTPSPFDFKLRPYLRPYMVDATRALNAGGRHRELMPWTMTGIYIATSALANDAPESERARYAALLDEVLEDMGVADASLWPARLRAADRLKDEVFRLADDIVAGRSAQEIKNPGQTARGESPRKSEATP